MSKVNKRVGIQHGEVLLFPVEDGELFKAESKTKECVVGHSETGHHHVVVSKKPFEIMGNVEKHDLYLRLFEPAKLEHKKVTDKHKTLKIPAGIWKVLHKTEYNPFAGLIQRVKD